MFKAYTTPLDDEEGENVDEYNIFKEVILSTYLMIIIFSVILPKILFIPNTVLFNHNLLHRNDQGQRHNILESSKLVL